MKLLALMLILIISVSAFGQEAQVGVEDAGKSTLFKEAAALFAAGKYKSTTDELNAVETKIRSEINPSKNQLGLVNYWKGVCYARLQDFPEAIKSFDTALQFNYSPLDLNYEYGQALFAADKLNEARLQFRESLNKKFKRAVSLYYIAFISKELGDKKKAITFFKAIEKLDPIEAKEVRQAAELQIGDIYLEQVEKHPDAFKSIEKYVIPQYKTALEYDKTSSLAPQIKEKIVNLQKKYDLVMFRLVNGRPTLIPPYFLRAATETGIDSNVTFSPTEQEVAESKKQSAYTKADFIGRYTFYHRNIMSISPEFRFNYTRYWNRIPEIYRSDNTLMAPALRTAYEHTLWNKPASTLFDYDYSYARRDIDQEEKLKFASRAHTLMLGERFNFFAIGETILRIRRRLFESYNSDQDSNSTSFVYEQIHSAGSNTLLYMFEYNMTRVEDDIYDTNSMTFRTDFIMSRVRDWFTPSFGVSVMSNKPINDSARGTELKISPSFRAAKTFKGNWRGNFKIEYDNYDSKDSANYAYKKYLTGVELEYLF